MSVVIIAVWQAKPDAVSRVSRGLAELTEATRAEPGNIRYDVHVRTDDPTTFVLVEEYESDEAVADHRASEHFQRVAIPLIDNDLRARTARRLIPADLRDETS